MTTNNWISPKNFVVVQVLPFLNSPKYLDLEDGSKFLWLLWKEKKSLSYNQRNTVGEILSFKSGIHFEKASVISAQSYKGH